MRFQDQLSKLKKVHKLLSLNTTTIQTSMGSRVRIDNIENFIEAIHILKSFSYLEKDVAVFDRYDIFDAVPGKSISMSLDSFNIFNSELKNLKDKIALNEKFLESTVVATEENTLCIKLIEHDSLKALAAELEIIDKIFMQVITHKDVNSSYKFSSFDIGSSWVYIVLGTPVALNLLAGLVWSACVIRKKWKEGTLLEETIKAMKVKNESLEDIRKTSKKLLDQLTEQEADNLMSTYKLDDSDNEYKKRLVYSITELSKLINDGVQIHPSLQAPEDSKNLFPDYTKLDSIEPRRKLLEKIK